MQMRIDTDIFTNNQTNGQILQSVTVRKPYVTVVGSHQTVFPSTFREKQSSIADKSCFLHPTLILWGEQR